MEEAMGGKQATVATGHEGWTLGNLEINDS